MSRRRHLELPALPTPLIGRDDEIAGAQRLIANGGRLVTVTGPPGVGKTSLALRLAHELADRFRYNVRLVDLAPIVSPADVAGAIAESLGIHRSGGRTPHEQAIRFVRDRRLLLVLDNFEQVAGAASEIAELLAGCPNLTVLATSRVPLGIAPERELRVGPLALPDLDRVIDQEAIARVAAVALFVERAAAVSRTFQLTDADARRVGEICVALDGLPLAIELAAARVRTVPLAEIHASLVGAASRPAEQTIVSPLDLLVDGARDLPFRQQTLRDSIAWSYNLLAPAEQATLRRLAVFVGGCSVETAERVAEASPAMIGTLARHGLMRHEPPATSYRTGGPPGQRMRLLEPVRWFGVEQLRECDEWEGVRQRHMEYFRDLAARSEDDMDGARRAESLARLAHDLDNLRAALRVVGTDTALERVVDELLARRDVAANRRPAADDSRRMLLRTSPPAPIAIDPSSDATPVAEDSSRHGLVDVAALTRREREVAIMLGRGHTTNRELAAVLGVTEGTAASYVQRVMSRLELRTRAQVAAWAVEHQIDVM